ncbi:hypothetical protein IU450_28410 [Nocardia abscessus]|uniref:hypothetical protein n=1 Tax=Nocardia abscessus TaxID=120957 RepID=UPI0018950278|nr:hypothetical protein [Nocardia abscessus]MBF6339783.1 hypothetical protein [Nocardia abscessus]
MSGAIQLGRVVPMSPQPGGNPASGPAALLAPEQLLAAISGHLQQDSPLIGWARELGDLHAALLPGHPDAPRHSPDSDETAVRKLIAEVVEQVNSWAVFHLPRPTGARKHTHSLGEVISHVAKTFADAWWTVRHTGDEQTRHEAWFHLAEVREGYADLLADIHARRIELPLGWRGVNPTS